LNTFFLILTSAISFETNAHCTVFDFCFKYLPSEKILTILVSTEQSQFEPNAIRIAVRET